MSNQTDLKSTPKINIVQKNIIPSIITTIIQETSKQNQRPNKENPIIHQEIYLQAVAIAHFRLQIKICYCPQIKNQKITTMT